MFSRRGSCSLLFLVASTVFGAASAEVFKSEGGGVCCQLVNANQCAILSEADAGLCHNVAANNNGRVKVIADGECIGSGAVNPAVAGWGGVSWREGTCQGGKALRPQRQDTPEMLAAREKAAGIKKFANIFDSTDHQITASFKIVPILDDFPAYITTYGLRFKDHRITIEVDCNNGTMTTILDGTLVTMPKCCRSEYNVTSDGEALLDWYLYRPGFGSSMRLSTPLIEFTISALPPIKPSDDADSTNGGEPAYLNGQLSLKAVPQNMRMGGILGKALSGALISASIGQEIAVKGNKYVDLGLSKAVLDANSVDSLFPAPVMDNPAPRQRVKPVTAFLRR